MIGPNQIVLGLGGTVDYEVEWDSAGLEIRAKELGVKGEDLADIKEITSERDLVISLLYFLDKGFSEERNVATPDIISSFASGFRYQVTLGGTPVRAALAMAVRKIPATVHLVSTNHETRELLPRGTRIISSATKDSLFPHLIFQYPSGTRIRLKDRIITSPRANRLIYTHDPPNEELLLSNNLKEKASDARIFLLSGLNIFKEEDWLRERVRQLTLVLEEPQADRTVIYEDAGFHIPKYSQIVKDALSPLVDVYSMNEEEAQQCIMANVDLCSGPEVTRMLRKLRELIPAKHLMVHTHLWAALVGPRASSFYRPLDAAVQMASARYLFGDALRLDQYDSVGSLPKNKFAEKVHWALTDDLGESFVFSSGFRLETERPTTIGLGDSFIGGFIAELASSPPAHL
jgi:ADP-dependent phosphofructokinase/glucokinase